MKNSIFVLLFLLFLSTSCHREKQRMFSLIPSEDSGIDFNNKIVETDSFNIITSEYIFNGGGVATGDFNNDNRPDLFFSGNQVSNKLYLNQGNLKFNDISKIAGIEAEDSWSTGVSVVDINNDGWLDIYICAAMLPSDEEKKNKLFVNQGLDDSGNPKFIEMAEQFGIAGNHNSMNATFFDYNKDGHLDLYVLNNVDIHVLPANYREKITDGSALSNDKLYRNNGDGTFTDVTIEAGIVIEGYGLGLAISDINYDGWPDIYVSNDYLTNDILYMNNKNGTFSNRIDDYIKHQSKFSMGSDISDFDNDGYVDIVTLDMLGETNQRLKTTIANNKYTSYILNEKFGYQYQYTRNMLQKGNGSNIPFSEIGLMAGVAKTDWSWAPLFADMNNDGLNDLLITNGFPRDITDLDFGEFKFNTSRYLKPSQILDSIPTIKIPNYAYKFIGNGKFEDVSEKWGLNVPSFSNGAAFVDLDGDGDLDYVTNNINDKAFLFVNNLNKKAEKHNYVSVKLKGPANNPLGIGAKVVLKSESGTFQTKEQYLSRGYMSSVDNILHFGLGDSKNSQSLEVLWPNGNYQKISQVSLNKQTVVAYNDAVQQDRSDLSFPLVQEQLSSPIFKEVSEEINIDYVHKEQDVVDYNVQRILPHKLTQNGPCLVSGDINGDGLEDFIIGSSSGFSPVVYRQNGQEGFIKSELFSDEIDIGYEEEDLCLFDLDNDGDLDLYLVSGSNEFMPTNTKYDDRLYINDGNGNFTKAVDRMPEIVSSGAVVSAHDFDSDGNIDLFVGGRTPFAQYPLASRSYLLKNNNGILEDVTDQIAPELANTGMVTDAIWSDIDNDGHKDLVLTGELMPITFFKNEQNSLHKYSDTGLNNLLGWWESVEGGDFDNDGDQDFIVGNMGRNNFYQPSQNRPATIIAKDFDNNGTIDPVMFAHFKNSFNDTSYQSFPVNFWGDLYGQSPLFRSKFNSFKAYAKVTKDSLFTDEELSGTKIWTGNYDKSIYLENLGNGQFAFKELPWQVQMAPINRTLATDFDNDGNLDLLMIGNDYGNEIFIGRYDALNGLLLKGNGKGDFQVVKPQKSGFSVTGDAKDLIELKSSNNTPSLFVVSQNRDTLRVFKNDKSR